MNHNLQPKKHRQRGVTAFCVIVTVAILAILSHNLVNEALEGYHQAALTRDAIALRQLADSALAQTLYYLNRGDRKAATSPVRESFGVARIKLGDGKSDLTLRVAAYAPNAEFPRSRSQTLFHLARDAKGRWSVASAEYEPIPLGGS